MPELQEALLDILMSTVTNKDGSWKKTSKERYCFHCNQRLLRNNRGIPITSEDVEDSDDEEWRSESLECGRAVNFTYYDHLVGIQNRETHPQWPEPEVAQLFRPLSSKKSSKKSDLSVEEIERKLKKSKREKPKSIELYNQV